MKIAVLGKGKIGGTLGKKWAQAGHIVTFGVRDPGSTDVEALIEDSAGNATVDSVAEAIAGGDVVVLAIPGTAAGEVVAANAQALNGKIVIDATNRFGAEEISSVRTIVENAPGAQVYRAFNSLGWENFAEPQIAGFQIDMVYCGPGGEAQETVERLISEIGLRPVRVGDLDQVRLVDNLGALWVRLVFGEGYGRRLAFKLLT